LEFFELFGILRIIWNSSNYLEFFELFGILRIILNYSNFEFELKIRISNSNLGQYSRIFEFVFEVE
jgi:hypothetical protein